MSIHFVEQRLLEENQSLSWDLAHHLYVRQFRGPALIVTERPPVLLPAVKKQWQKIVKQAELERARTLKPERVAVLDEGMRHMLQLNFTTDAEDENFDVLFVTLDDLPLQPNICNTIYVTVRIEKATLEVLKRPVSKHGVIVLYILADTTS